MSNGDSNPDVSRNSGAQGNPWAPSGYYAIKVFDDRGVARVSIYNSDKMLLAERWIPARVVHAAMAVIGELMQGQYL